MIVEVKNDNLDEVLSFGKVSVLDFHAKWCGPCKVYGPILDKFAKDNEDIGVGKVDIDDNKELIAEYGIRNVPTTILLLNGKVVTKIPGVIQQENLEEFVENLR